MIITKNSDAVALYGAARLVALTSVDDNFTDMALLRQLLENAQISNDEVEYIMIVAEIAVTTALIPSLIISDEALNALYNAFNMMEDVPFTITAEAECAMYIPKNYDLTINFDGSGNYTYSLIDVFLSSVMQFADGVDNREILLPLYNALKAKKGKSDNYRLSISVPSQTFAANLKQAINNALTLIDSEGDDSTVFFENGYCDD